MKLTPLITGLALQAGAALTGWLSLRVLYSMGWFGVLVISVPMFVASIFPLMKSGLALPLRLLLSFWILAFPLYYIAAFAIASLAVRTEVFLIPAGYRGNVTVRFDSPGGAPIHDDGERLMLRIGPNGELNTRAHVRRFENSLDSTRHERRQYFFVDAAGTQVRIESPSPYDPSTLPADRVIATDLVEYLDGDRVSRVVFAVGTTAEIEKFREIPR